MNSLMKNKPFKVKVSKINSIKINLIKNFKNFKCTKSINSTF